MLVLGRVTQIYLIQRSRSYEEPNRCFQISSSNYHHGPDNSHLAWDETGDSVRTLSLKKFPDILKFWLPWKTAEGQYSFKSRNETQWKAKSTIHSIPGKSWLVEKWRDQCMLIALRLLAFLSNTSASSSHGKMPGTPLTVGFLELPMAFICQGFQGENSSIISST